MAGCYRKDSICTTYIYLCNISAANVKRFGVSDPFAISCNRKGSFSLNKKKSHKSIKYRSSNNFDESAFLYDLLSVLWNQIEFYDTIDDILARWYSLFITTVDKHAPIKTNKVKHDIQHDWITSGILVKIKERDNLKKRGRHDEYKTLRNEISVIFKTRKSHRKNLK